MSNIKVPDCFHTSSFSHSCNRHIQHDRLLLRIRIHECALYKQAQTVTCWRYRDERRESGVLPESQAFLQRLYGDLWYLAIDGALIDGDHVLGGSEAVKKWQDETIALEEQLKLLHEEQLCSTTAHWNLLDGLSAGVRGLKENTHICYTAEPAAMKRYALEALEYEVTRLSEMSGHGNSLLESYKLFANRAERYDGESLQLAPTDASQSLRLAPTDPDQPKRVLSGPYLVIFLGDQAYNSLTELSRFEQSCSDGFRVGTQDQTDNIRALVRATMNAVQGLYKERQRSKSGGGVASTEGDEAAPSED